MRGVMAAAAILVGACSFDGDPAGTQFRCEEQPRCPDGFICSNGVCVEPDQVGDADASPDPDGPPVDAAPIDAWIEADAATDFCEAAMSGDNADSCGAASPDVTAAARMPGGVRVYADTRQYINDLGTPASSGDCIGYATGGYDAFYKLTDVAAGERIYASVQGTGDWDTVLYLVEGCVTGVTCFAGDDNANTDGEEITYTVQQDGDFYVVVDATVLAAAGCFELTIIIEQT